MAGNEKFRLVGQSAQTEVLWDLFGHHFAFKGSPDTGQDLTSAFLFAVAVVALARGRRIRCEA